MNSCNHCFILFFYCVLLCNQWLVSYVDPLSNPLLKLLSIWASLNHCWPNAPCSSLRDSFLRSIFFPQIFLENLPSCFTVLAEKGARVKIGGEGGLMGQNTPTQSSQKKLQTFTWPPLWGWKSNKNFSLSRCAAHFSNPSSSWCRNDFLDFSLAEVWLHIFRRGNKHFPSDI